MKLQLQSDSGFTSVSNRFIDCVMSAADGEYVKVYLYLLRCACAGKEISVSSVADFFDHTEKDIVRAFSYWEKVGMLRLEISDNGKLLSAELLLEPAGSDEAAASADTAAVSGTRTAYTEPAAASQLQAQAAAQTQAQIQAQTAAQAQTQMQAQPLTSAQTAAPASYDEALVSATAAASAPASETDVPMKKRLSADERTTLSSQEAMKRVIFVAETLKGNALSQSEVDAILYIGDKLRFSEDLLGYLIEYCASRNAFSARYMEHVAQAWYQKGISTVQDAAQESKLYNKNYYIVLEALGVKGRGPAPGETDMIDKWMNTYGLPIPIIEEACRRTIIQTAKPSLKYADGILNNWKEAGVRTMNDIRRLDITHEQKKKGSEAAAKAAAANAASASRNRFNNFQQRDYDFAALEQQLLHPQAAVRKD